MSGDASRNQDETDRLGSVIAFLKTSSNGLPQVRLEGPRVYLRPPRAADWQDWAALRAESREFLTPWEPTWPADALARSAFVRRLRRQASEWRNDEGFSFLTFAKADDRMIGGLGITNVRRGVAQMASIGYWTGRPFVRRGYMTEAVKAALEFGFSQLGLHRIEAACIPTNIASKGLLEKIGFRAEGEARNYLRINGEWRDHLLYAILREDLRD